MGNAIAAKITDMNPKPMKLRFEKVYHPCILMTKKRYVGFKYESPTQKEPIYEAKGTETVRRDGCPAVVKMVEKSLSILFNTKDLSAVKTYVQRQWLKILSDRVSVQDFIFAKEVRLGTYSYVPFRRLLSFVLRKTIGTADRRRLLPSLPLRK